MKDTKREKIIMKTPEVLSCFSFTVVIFLMGAVAAPSNMCAEVMTLQQITDTASEYNDYATERRGISSERLCKYNHPHHPPHHLIQTS